MEQPNASSSSSFSSKYDTYINGGKGKGKGKRERDQKGDKEVQREKSSDIVRRSSSRKEIENRLRWNILVQILDAKHDEGGSKWNELTSNVLEHIRLESKMSFTEIKDIWREYTAQHNNGNHEISMISNRHSELIRKTGSSSGDWERECEQHDKESRYHHYRDRFDGKGNRYSIQKVVEIIAEVNNQKGQELTIRELSAEILSQFDLYLPRSTLCNILRDFKFDVEISHVKPMLSLKARRKRICYVLSQLEPSGVVYLIDGHACFKFSTHENRVSKRSNLLLSPNHR